MLKNYFITALNNLIKNKLYSVINIAGLAIGISACLVIALYVKDQYSYDKQWKDSERIHRVNFSATLPGKPRAEFSTSPLPAMQVLSEYFKDKIEKSARVFAGEMTIDIGTDKFKGRVADIDRAFIDIFKLETIAGSLEETLTSINNVALSEEISKRHFGKEDPIGKVITMSIENIQNDYKVTAVYRIPGNTVLDLPVLALFDDTLLPASIKNWFNFNCSTYVKLKEGVDVETMKPLLAALIDRNIDISKIISDPGLKSSDIVSMDFQRLEDAHLDSPWDVYRAGGNKTVVISFAAISLLVLLIGSINFTILTTAKATQRAREVAMRKVVGAKRKQLIAQFLGESLFIVLLSMILSMGVVEIMLPIFEAIVGKSFSLNYTSPSTFLPLLALLIIVGISGGLYPAFILSGFKPGETLKANQSKETRGSMSLRNILVVFQFSISVILIVSTGVIFTQMRYSMNRDPGYNKENLLVITRLSANEKVKGKIEVLKQELLNLPDVTNAGVSQVEPSQQQQSNLAYTHPGHPETTYIKATTSVGYDYFKTYRIPIVAGREYSIERDIPDPKIDMMTTTIGGNETKELIERNLIINESAAREFGFSSPEEAVGEMLNSTTINNISYTIIGVVADNHIFSMRTLPRAEVYQLDPDGANVMTVRFNSSPKKILNGVNEVWKKVMGDEEISTVFVDQLIAQEFQQEKTEQKVLISFSILAILIACMGLFGSAAFTVERRTREIGLRKVMGARIKNIVSLLLWQFSKPVLIANIIAWPVAIFVMRNWLERFPYRINLLLLIPICIVSGLIALVIAWSTVAGNTTRAARKNPIHSLRYE
ncbi:MAG: FtsX-like permease family protein [Desulfatiglans sp.]|jgi:putative ABC transport system permease protein|nr:FtsX-like permease family protein [Desulfatiglans sp.]